MRVTVKYVGESYSGEYIANHVIHEFSVYGGYTTTLYLKRNMAGGEKKRVSPIDSEMMRERLRRMEERMHGPVDQEAAAMDEAEVEPEAATETTPLAESQETGEEDVPEESIEEKFEQVRGRPYATSPSMQSYDIQTGILTVESKAFNCIGLISYLYNVKAAYDVANFDNYEEFERLKNINTVEDLNVNDIIRWCGSNEDGVNNHVQIWRGDDTTWEACYGKGVIVRIGYGKYEQWYKKAYTNCEITYYRRK